MDKLLTSSDFVGVVSADDQLSKLPNDILLNILSRLSTKESVRTSMLSTRWVHMWKELSRLYLDMRKISMTKHLLIDAGRSITKVINDHRGHLRSCTINHRSFQCGVGMIETWLQALVHVKHVKYLALLNYHGYVRGNNKANTTLVLPPDSFFNPNLESVMLSQYNLEALRGFNNSKNLRKLSLKTVFASVEVFNAMIASCTSLEVVMLQICCHEKSGPLKIENSKLKFLYLACSNIDRIEVSTLSVDILFVGKLSCEKENLVIANPNLQFNRNYWNTGGHFEHTSYNITCPPKGEKCIGHEFLLNASVEYMYRSASMSVRVDLMNTKEVDMLKEVLDEWPGEMGVLEIVFKNNKVIEGEGESSTGGTLKTFSEETKPFPNYFFRVFTVYFFNFRGSKEEFALASCFITQGTVVRTMMIKPSLCCSPSKKMEIEAGVANLKKLPKGEEELQILLSYNEI